MLLPKYYDCSYVRIYFFHTICTAKIELKTLILQEILNKKLCIYSDRRRKIGSRDEKM